MNEDAERVALIARHEDGPEQSDGKRCLECDQLWPCDSKWLLDQLDARDRDYERVNEEYLSMRDSYAALEGVELGAELAKKELQVLGDALTEVVDGDWNEGLHTVLEHARHALSRVTLYRKEESDDK